MFLYKNRIVVTGGNGRFGKVIKENAKNFKFFFLFSRKKRIRYIKSYFYKKIFKKEKTKIFFSPCGFIKANENSR